MITFRALHHTGTPLLLPNAWDHASAVALAEQGFPAIGTTSLGVAAAAGLADGTAATRGETLLLAHRLGRGPYLLSVDAEAGFSNDPEEVGQLARDLAAAGAAGINLEDGRNDGTLTPATAHAAKIAAVKAAAPDLFVNARTDTYWLGGREAETSRRLDAYRQRMGWTVPWYSSADSDFNFDFHVSFYEDRGPDEYNFTPTEPFTGEGPGTSAFLRVDDDVFHTYSAFARGGDEQLGTYTWLDMTALGRQEDWEEPKGRSDGPFMNWVRRHDEY